MRFSSLLMLLIILILVCRMGTIQTAVVPENYWGKWEAQTFSNPVDINIVDNNDLEVGCVDTDCKNIYLNITNAVVSIDGKTVSLHIPKTTQEACSVPEMKFSMSNYVMNTQANTLHGDVSFTLGSSKTIIIGTRCVPFNPTDLKMKFQLIDGSCPSEDDPVGCVDTSNFSYIAQGQLIQKLSNTSSSTNRSKWGAIAITILVCLFILLLSQ